MLGKATKMVAEPVEWRIGEVAKLTGVTTRTLRYWEELGLLQPSSYRASGERLYSPTDVARVTRIATSRSFSASLWRRFGRFSTLVMSMCLIGCGRSSR